MSSIPVKRTVDESVSLQAVKKRRSGDIQTDYAKCIICQGETKSGLNNIQTFDKLKLAVQARLDKIAVRLQPDIENETWLDTEKPKWHGKCRNWYINEKSYKLAEKKRQGSGMLAEGTEKSGPEEPSAGPSLQSTRSHTAPYDAKVCCVICNCQWFRGKEPQCKVSTQNSQRFIIDKANKLNREDILQRVIGAGHDMVANDICYHMPCMNAFKARRIPTVETTGRKPYDVAFTILVERLEVSLFHDQQAFLVKSLRDQYRQILGELGVKTAHNYRSITLKWKLVQHFGSRIAVLDRSCGSAFICASTVPLGDALEKLRQIEKDNNVDDRQKSLHHAAKILREDARKCKKEAEAALSTDISIDAASKIVPDSFFNFTASLLSDKVNALSENVTGRVSVNHPTAEKALMLSQQLLQQMSGVVTPLAIGTAYHLYNQKRSKDLIILNNKLGQGISYDTLQRKLTSQSAAIMQQVNEDGVYVPDSMSRNSSTLQVFAMDNLDWKKKTLEGGSFHATTAIIIEPPEPEAATHEPEVVSIPISTSRRRTLLNIAETSKSTCHVTAKDRLKGRSLSNIPSVESLSTECDGTAHELLLMWYLGRLMVATLQLTVEDIAAEAGLPGFSAFCARLFGKKKASKIAYLPLIPASPTDPAVLKEEMTRLVQTSTKLGNQWTIITGDQATYELALVVKEKHKELFSKVVLLLGGFHQAHNYMKAVLKIMNGSGAEELLVSAGLCQEGTAKKIFGEKADYYQSLHALWILSEAMWRLFWDAFEVWAEGKDTTLWIDGIGELLRKLLENKVEGSKQLELIRESHQEITALLSQMSEFQHSLEEHPTSVFWVEFLEMSAILHRFIFYQREGDWMGHLSESAKMLPYLTAAGHYKYGQQSLPIYLHEMKQLPDTAPEVHEALMAGAFVGRRTNGHHNAVSPDMLLEQTYNADAKEASGLGGITQNTAACTKWIYTKSVTAAVSSQLKAMLHLNSETENPHHESGQTRVSRDAELVSNVMAAVESNPFMTSSPQLINIATGQHAQSEVQHDLTHVKAIGHQALAKSVENLQKKTSTVRLNTFQTQNKAKKSGKTITPGKSDEVTALLRMTQIIASGGKVDVVQYVGNHECSNTPQSLFDDDGAMRSTGNKANLVKAIKEETKVCSLEAISNIERKTAVVVDAMYMIRRLSFQKDQQFGEIAVRYRNCLLTDVPHGTSIVHFCCDRYRTPSMKAGERHHRSGKSRAEKVYEVNDHFKAPDPTEFFAVAKNKARLLRYLCEKWSTDEIQNPALGSTRLYLGGGFEEETKSVLLTKGSVTRVPSLESTQEEADTRILLHAIYSVQNEDVQRVIVHANDTDVIVMCIYYASTLLNDLEELWVRTGPDNYYLPIHQIAKSLGPAQCRALPFLHSLSGRDTTSYPYFTSKKGWFITSKKIDTPALEDFAESDDLLALTDEVKNQARDLLIGVYTKRVDMLGSSLAEIRANKFLNNKSTLLKLLPPTEDAYMQHLKRAALATIIDKRAHVAKPVIPSIEDYGWTVSGDKLTPVTSTTPLWPQKMAQSITCGCTKGCKGNCSCAKKQVACYIGCKCTGSLEKCSRARYLAQFAEISDSDSDANDD